MSIHEHAHTHLLYQNDDLSAMCLHNQVLDGPGKTRLLNDLLCVEWDVKPYTLTHFEISASRPMHVNCKQVHKSKLQRAHEGSNEVCNFDSKNHTLDKAAWQPHELLL